MSLWHELKMSPTLLNSHASWVGAFAFSSDCTQLALGLTDGIIQLQDGNRCRTVFNQGSCPPSRSPQIRAGWHSACIRPGDGTIRLCDSNSDTSTGNAQRSYPPPLVPLYFRQMASSLHQVQMTVQCRYWI